MENGSNITFYVPTNQIPYVIQAILQLEGPSGILLLSSPGFNQQIKRLVSLTPGEQGSMLTLYVPTNQIPQVIQGILHVAQRDDGSGSILGPTNNQVSSVLGHSNLQCPSSLLGPTIQAPSSLLGPGISGPSGPSTIQPSTNDGNFRNEGNFRNDNFRNEGNLWDPVASKPGTISDNRRLFTKSNGSNAWDTTAISLSPTTSFTVEIVSCNANFCNIMFGFADKNGFNHSTPTNFKKCGWFFYGYNRSIYSYKGDGGNAFSTGERLKVGDKVTLTYNRQTSQISVAVNGVNLGIAFHGVTGDLYACVDIYDSNSSVRLS
jgi:hypothetical protein